MASATVERVCTKLAGLRPAGGGYIARCPAHEDQHQSLSITEGTDGRVLVKCHAGCPTGSIVRALGYTLADLFPSPRDKTTPVATYPYCDAAGALVYEVVRFPGKEFRQRRPDGHGGWKWDLQGVDRIPYRLHHLQRQPVVVLVEGEKDVETLWALGIPATCNSGGAGKWKVKETMALKNAGCQRVVILPDNDEAGRKHAEDVAGRCRGAGMSVSVLPLPGLPLHGDVTDWLTAGHAKAELEQLIAGTPYVVQAAPAALPDTTVAEREEADDKKVTQGKYAARFAEEHASQFRFDVRRKAWMRYDAPRWRYDPGKTVRRAMMRFVQGLHKEALKMSDYERRQRLVKFALQSESRTGIEALVSMAEWHEAMAESGDAWDTNPWLLAVKNGVVDLRTGELRDATPDDRLTMLANASYTGPDTPCERWYQFLHEVFNDDGDLIEFVRLLCGYMLTGATTEQVLIICYGSGGNGKSIFLGTLRQILGDYATTLPFSSLSQQSAETVSNDLAAIQGRRLVAASEINEGVRLNEARLKSLTGGDQISARFLYSEHFTFTPVAKFVLSVNHKPVVRDDSHGFWRRVRLLPFMMLFDGEQKDPKLADKLAAEADGILAWAIQGCLSWQRYGLTLPAAVASATADYEADSDPLAEFLKASCDVGDEEQVSAGEAYRAYDEWCNANKLGKWDRLSANAFGRLMGGRFKRRHTANGAMYAGVSAKPLGRLY